MQHFEFQHSEKNIAKCNFSRTTNTILLIKDHVLQRLTFANIIIENGIKGTKIMFTDECRIVYSKANPKINIIRLNEYDRKNIHFYEVNEKRAFNQQISKSVVLWSLGILVNMVCQI